LSGTYLINKTHRYGYECLEVNV